MQHDPAVRSYVDGEKLILREGKLGMERGEQATARNRVEQAFRPAAQAEKESGFSR